MFSLLSYSGRIWGRDTDLFSPGKELLFVVLPKILLSEGHFSGLLPLFMQIPQENPCRFSCLIRGRLIRSSLESHK